MRFLKFSPYLLFICLMFPLFATAQNKDSYQQFAMKSCLPTDLRIGMASISFFDKYNMNEKLNPFYLRGDFNGDQKPDYAICVQDKKTKQIGIAVFTSPTNYRLVGMGHPPANYKELNDFKWMNAWYVYSENTAFVGPLGEKEEIQLDHEAIEAIKLESASGLIYWDGEKFIWYQQGD